MSGTRPTAAPSTTSGWWYLVAPAVLAMGSLLAGTVVLVALSAAGGAVADQPTVPTADTAVLDVASPGRFVVFARYRVDVGGQPVDEPLVVVLDPAGGALVLDDPDPAQSWDDGNGALVAIGDVTTKVAGPHRVVVGPVATDLVTGVVVVPDPLAGVATALGWALGIVVVSIIGAVVVVVTVALRRHRRAATPVRDEPVGAGPA